MKKDNLKPWHVLIVCCGLAAASIGISIIYVFYLLGAIRGFSTGLFSIVPLTIIINGWFKKHHGLATSIVFGFSGLAGAICSPILSKCIDLYGWNMGYIIKAGIILILCLPAIIYPFEVSAKEEEKVPLGYDKSEGTSEEIYGVTEFNFVTTIFICFCIFSIINTTITGITQHLPGFAESIGLSKSIFALSLVGYVYDFTNSYNMAFILGIGINICCLILMFIIIKNEDIK